MTTFQSLTIAMQRREIEIARMTAYINKVGEAGAGSEYLKRYAEELRMWDEMKAKRDQLKQAA